MKGHTTGEPHGCKSQTDKLMWADIVSDVGGQNALGGDRGGLKLSPPYLAVVYLLKQPAV